MMKCPCCGAMELVVDTRDVTTVFKGVSLVIPDVTGERCSACREVILDRERGDKFSTALGDARAFFKQRGAAAVRGRADAAWAKVSSRPPAAEDVL